MDFGFELKALGYTTAAVVLGAAIGFDRQLAEKPAGMRTHMLVAGAAALLVALGDGLVEHFSGYRPGLVRSDPIGLIAAAVTGVSFLGAGTIIRGAHESPVEGLTTAASLLFTAVVGICAATHQLFLASGATALALLTLRTVRALEIRAIEKRRRATPPANEPAEDKSRNG